MNAFATVSTTSAPTQPASGLPTYDAKALTQDGALAQIVLNQQIYVLRITRAGKLILTK